MPQQTAHDFDQELLALFDAYVHGGLDRRGFLEKAAKFAVGGVTAAMLLDQLSPKFLEAQKIPTDDVRLRAEHIEYDSPNGYGRAANCAIQEITTIWGGGPVFGQSSGPDHLDPLSSFPL